MSHSVPALPALPPMLPALPRRRGGQSAQLPVQAPAFWPELPGLLAAWLGPEGPAMPLVCGGERPAGAHVYVECCDDAAAAEAMLEGQALRVRVPAGGDAFALALIAAFLRAPGRPAAAAPASRAALALAARVAAHDVPVLIEGPTGSGKEGLARFIHSSSQRRDCSLVAVNCAALPETMLEAALFGHERGAFTGAVAAGRGLFREADGGTLLLDEVAELPLACQAKLLRALQEKEILPVGATRPVKVNVRVLAAGNRDLAAEVAAGRFRADLYWRLAVFPLATLPLAARPDDVLAIAAAWLLRRMAERGDAGGVLRVPWLTADAQAALQAHGWPGNVRELGNVLDRALVMMDGAAIAAADLMIMAEPGMAADASAPLQGRVRDVEARAIADVLAATPTRRAAAERLGISERTLRYKLAGHAGRAVAAAAGMTLQ